MSLASLSNRRLAVFVSLLYVFFSTFGALTHSHAASEPTGASSAADTHRQTSLSQVGGGSVPAHCPVCEWQSVQVTSPPSLSPVTPPVLLRFEQTASLFRLSSLPATRSSSRGPPRA